MSTEISETQLATDLLEAMWPLITRAVADRSLSSGKMGVLRHLSTHARATTSELAAAIRVSQQGVSLATRELESMGLIERVQDDADRRRIWLVLTEAGRQKHAQEAVAGREGLELAIREHLSRQERDELRTATQVMRKLSAATES